MRPNRLPASVKISLVLFLLGTCLVLAPPATAQPQALTGWFSFTVADYPTESGLVSETTYSLTEDSGERHELLIDIDLMRPLGGPVALNRKRVTVEGEWEPGGVAATEQFRAISIELAASQAETATPASSLHAQVTGSQAWVTILCRFGDAPAVTPHPVRHYERFMGSAYPGLGHYWKEVSYENIPDLRGSRVVGWYNLPQPRSYYVFTDEDGEKDYDTDRAVEDCTAVADADVFFPDFWGISLVFNQNFPGGARGGSVYMTKDGQTRFWGVTWLPEWGHKQDTWAHEMGHAFGLQHSSGPYGQDDPPYSPTTYDSEWDVMSGGRSLSPYPGYGDLGVHTIAYHKDFLGWIPASRKYVPTRNGTRTITLARLAQPGSGGYLLAQIPIGDSATDFYTVETRRFAGYDDEIPDEAVVIHKVDTTRADRLAQVVDVDNNGDPNDAGAIWTPGETFTDRANGIQVSVDAAWSTSYRVTITATQVGVRKLLFEDDLETGTEGWSGATCRLDDCSAGSPWALTTTVSHSGTHAWTDSPSGNYQNDQEVVLWSPMIDLTEVPSATLTFWHRYAFGRGDSGNVWVSRRREDGQWYTEHVRTFIGTRTTWQQVSIDLTPYAGSRIGLAFGLFSDASGTADGWTIDDVAVFPPQESAPQARLGNPQPHSFQSGVGVISGWACHAEEIVIELNGDPQQAAYGTPRTDTRDACGDTNNGFGLLVNWNNLGAGTHTVRALLDGVEFANTTVRVTTLAPGEAGKFLLGLSGTVVVPNFPRPGEDTTLRWEQALQNFVITDGQPNTGGGKDRVAGVQAILGNPSLGSAQSGIGVISGWACEAEAIVIELNGSPQQAGYGTPRTDTQDECGDTNNGFGLLVNWNNLGAGTHTVRALLDGVEFANTTVRVTTLAPGEAGKFLSGLSGTVVVPNFPRPGEDTTLRWEQALQNFVIMP